MLGRGDGAQGALDPPGPLGALQSSSVVGHHKSQAYGGCWAILVQDRGSITT